MRFKLIMMILLLAGSTWLSGCEAEGPAESVGENIDQGMEDAGRQIEEAVNQAQNKVEEAVDQAQGEAE